MTHQVAHLVEVGQPALLVAGLIGLVAWPTPLGRVFWEWLSDRWWLEASYATSIRILGLGMAVLLSIGPSTARGVLYVSAILVGIGSAVSPPSARS